MTKYFTRHQSLKHLWYQRYNSRTSSRWDGVVPWYAKEGFKSGAWKKGCLAAWNQLMKERELLYINGNIAKAQIVEIKRTKSGSLKLLVNVDNPYAEKWDFGDVNEVTIRKSDEETYKANYGLPGVGKSINVTLDIYHRVDTNGLSYKIKYPEDKKEIKKEGEKFMDFEERPAYEAKDCQILNAAIEKHITAYQSMDMAIITENLMEKENIISMFNDAKSLFKQIDLNNPRYGVIQKKHISREIAGCELNILWIQQRWIQEVELKNIIGNDKKKELYQKLGEIFLKVSEARQNVAKEIYNNEIEYKDEILNSIHNLLYAHACFYKSEQNNDKGQNMIKYLEKYINFFETCPKQIKEGKEDLIKGLSETLITMKSSDECLKGFANSLV